MRVDLLIYVELSNIKKLGSCKPISCCSQQLKIFVFRLNVSSNYLGRPKLKLDCRLTVIMCPSRSQELALIEQECLGVRTSGTCFHRVGNLYVYIVHIYTHICVYVPGNLYVYIVLQLCAVCIFFSPFIICTLNFGIKPFLII